MSTNTCECRVPNCNKSLFRHGYWNSHRQQWERRDRPATWLTNEGYYIVHALPRSEQDPHQRMRIKKKPKPYVRPFKTDCCVPGCERSYRGQGYCSAHLNYWVARNRPSIWLTTEGYLIVHGLPEEQQDPWPRPFLVQKRECRVPTCKGGIRQNGYCNRHQCQWRNRGKPDEWTTSEGIVVIHSLSRYDQDREQARKSMPRRPARRKKTASRKCKSCSKRMSSSVHDTCQVCRKGEKKATKRYCKCGRWLRGKFDSCHKCRRAEQKKNRPAKRKKAVTQKPKAKVLVQSHRAKPLSPRKVPRRTAPDTRWCRYHPDRKAHANGHCYHCIVMLKSVS